MSFSHFKVCFLLAGLRFSHLAASQSNTQFGQVVNINGDMSLNSFIFPDNSKIELFSQTQRQLLVNQNPAPLNANHVIGSTGQPFVQLSTNSMSISTNGATDLVGAQIEMSINPTMLQQSGVTADNAFVAMLSPNRQAWIVMENLKAVNSTDNTVRMIKLNAIDGEYMAVGRQTVETFNVVTPFGTPQQGSVNISGSGIQEVEFQDGFRMSIMASKQMTVSANVQNGISSSMLPNIASVNNYRYLVTTNLAGVLPNLDQMMAVVQLPLNAQRLMTVATSMGIGPNDTVSLGISQRGVIQNPGGATSLSPQKRQEKADSSIKSASTKSVKTSTSSASSKATVASASNSTETSAPEPSITTTASSSVSSASSASASSALSSSSAGASLAAASEPTSTPTSSPPPASNTTPQNNPAATQLLLSPTFTPITAPTVLDTLNMRVAVTVSQLDGEFIVTMARGAVNGLPSGSVGSAGAGAANGVGAAGLLGNVKRQAQSEGSVVMTMQEIQQMVERQKAGGSLGIDVLGMMGSMKASSAATGNAGVSAPTRRLKRRGPLRGDH